MTPRLRIVSSELPGRAGFVLELGSDTVVIGRAADCAVHLDDPSVSRRHARVEPRAGGWAVVDLGSANGIVVGDDRVTELQLERGGRFSIGGSLFEYEGPAPEPVIDTEATIVRPRKTTAPAAAPAEFVVQVVSSKGGEPAGREFRVAGGGGDIGRDEGCAVALTRDASVSRRHARVEMQAGGGFRVTDLGSANGIWADDRRVPELHVEDGQPFRVGDCIVACRSLHEGPRSDATQAMSDLGELMAKVAARRLEQAGQAVELGARSPVLLDDPRLAYHVASGKVEVFTVAVEDGRPRGPRQHFVTVAAGSVMLGFARDAVPGSGFLAVGGAGTVVRRLSREELVAVAEDAQLAPVVASLVDGWVHAVAARLTRDIHPRPVAHVALPPGVGGPLAPGQRARAEEGVVWTSGDGALLYAGMATVPPGDGGYSFFPLTPQTWLEPDVGVAEPVSLVTCATSDLLASPLLWAGLDRFHDVVCECEFVNKRLAAVDEYQRLDRKARESEAAREAAFDAIGAVLGGRAPEPAVETGAGQLEPVLAAARLVGAQLGIDVRPPAEALGERTFHDHVAAIAAASGFRVRTVALRGTWWRTDAGPLLGCDGEGAPVALLPRGARSYTCVRVSDGTRQRVTEAVADALVPFAFAFYRPLPPAPLGALDLWRFARRGLLSDRAMVLALGVATGLLGAAIPLFVGHVVDRAIPQAERTVLLQLGLGMLAVTSCAALLQLAKSVAVVRLESRMDYALQAAVWDRLLELPSSFFRRYGAGDLAERASGISAIRGVLSRSAVGATLGALGALAYVAVMLVISVPLALVALGVALALAAFSTAGNLLLIRAQRAEVDLHGQISSLVLQLIAGVAKVRVSGAENHAFRVWAQRFSEQKRLSFRLGRLGASLATVTAGFQVLATLAIFAAIYHAPSGSVLSTGQFVAFYTAFGSFALAVQGLATASLSLVAVVPFYQRLKPILDTTPETDGSKAYPGRLHGEITVSHVSFRYRPEAPLVLQDVSFTIRPGEFVAFVGPSGCGKSTLLRLLLGFEKPTTGAVSYDGLDLAHLDVRAVRQQLGVVLQESRLLPTDIFRNVVGNGSRTMEEAWEALEMAGLADDVRQMPMQLQTVVSEGGGTFSGGQRQRLLIARALVNKPRILLFDEATSALDNRAQAVVTRSMAQLDATRVVVAHRLSTVVDADRILFLDGGRVREEGTYAELMRRGGLFAEFARRQMA